MFHSMKEDKFTRIENLFYDAKDSLETISRQYIDLIEMYKQKEKIELELIKEEYNSEYDLLKPIFDSLLGSYGESDELNYQIAEHESGIKNLEDNYHYDRARVKSKFLEYFDFSSKSHLVSIYSLLENSLRVLCDELSDKFNKRIKPSDFGKRDYLQNSISYLDLVIELDLTDVIPIVDELRQYQFIRNKIVHTLAEFNDVSEISAIIAANTSCLKLIKNKLIFKSDNYNKNFKTSVDKLLGELMLEINQKLNFEFTIRGLDHCFQILEDNLQIMHLNVKKVSNKSSQFEFDVVSESSALKSFKVRINVKRNDVTNSFSILSQVDNQKIIEFVNFINKHDQMFYKYIFKYLLWESKFLEIKVLIY